MSKEQTARIRALNDTLRQTRRGGQIILTKGVHARGGEFILDALQAVSETQALGPANDPYGEHDLGVVVVDEKVLLWKIDYYDIDLKSMSPDPSDPNACRRVLTLMLAEEY